MTSNISGKSIGSAIKSLITSESLEKTRITPVILSVVHDEDGYSHKELRKFKIARLLREAYEQKGVLSQADVAEMLGVSTGTVSKDIREYQIENQVVL